MRIEDYSTYSVAMMAVVQVEFPAMDEIMPARDAALASITAGLIKIIAVSLKAGD